MRGCSPTIGVWLGATAARHPAKAELRTASVLKGGRVVFNIGGNKYRVVLAIDYQRQLAKVHFVGTHAQFDRIDAENI